MRLNKFLAIATMLFLSHDLCAQNTKQLLLLLKNARTTVQTRNKLNPIKFCEMILKLVTDAADPADPSVADGNGITALHWAAGLGDAGLTRALCERGANLNAIGNGLTPLHHAAMYNQPDAISVLVGFGVDVNVATQLGETPLHFAAEHGCLASIVRLMWYNARINCRTSNGQSALALAFLNGHVGATALLIAFGADLPDVVTAPPGLSYRQREAIDLLLACMPHRNPSARFRVLYDYVVSENDGLLALAILESQLRPGDTLLHTVLRLNRVDMLELVLNHLSSNAELALVIDQRNANGDTALAFALRIRSFAAANLLLYAGADPFRGTPSSLTLAYQIPQTTTFAYNQESSLFDQIYWQTLASMIMRLVSFTLDETTLRSHLCYPLLAYIIELLLELEKPRYLR